MKMTRREALSASLLAIAAPGVVLAPRVRRIIQNRPSGVWVREFDGTWHDVTEEKGGFTSRFTIPGEGIEIHWGDNPPEGYRVIETFVTTEGIEAVRMDPLS